MPDQGEIFSFSFNFGVQAFCSKKSRLADHVLELSVRLGWLLVPETPPPKR